MLLVRFDDDELEVLILQVHFAPNIGNGISSPPVSLCCKLIGSSLLLLGGQSIQLLLLLFLFLFDLTMRTRFSNQTKRLQQGQQGWRLQLVVCRCRFVDRLPADRIGSSGLGKQKQLARIFAFSLSLSLFLACGLQGSLLLLVQECVCV